MSGQNKVLNVLLQVFVKGTTQLATVETKILEMKVCHASRASWMSPGPIIGLTGNFLFHAGQFLLQVQDFILMELC